jgi:hypothetical protein
VIIRALPNPALDRLREQVFGPFGEAMAEVGASYRETELAVINSYLRRVTDVLREHTARLSGGTVTAGLSSGPTESAQTG